MRTFEQFFTEASAILGKDILNVEGLGYQLDFHTYSEELFGNNTVADTSIDGNANVSEGSIVTANYERHKPQSKLESLRTLWTKCNELYGNAKSERLLMGHLMGDYYINDLSDCSRPYCFNYSLMDLALNGLNMIERPVSVPPKHLLAFKAQVEQFLGVASNNTLGATGMADLLIVMACFVDKALETNSDGSFRFQSAGDVWRYVNDLLTSLIYTLNQPLFRGNQSPFTNVTVYDDVFLDELIPKYVINGRTPSKETIKHLQMNLLGIMNEELARTPLTFPVITAAMAKDSEGNIRDREFLNEIAGYNLMYGFIQFFHSEDVATIASCCRLRSRLDLGYANSFGSGATKIGSLGVVTLNLPRCAATVAYQDVPRFLRRIEELVESAAEINNAKREILKDRIASGKLPLYTLKYMELAKQYSTCGQIGFPDAIQILGKDALSTEGLLVGDQITDTINAANMLMDERFGTPHNCEQVPGEASAVKLAKKDTILGLNVLNLPFYANQFVPLDAPVDLLTRIDVQARYDAKFSGGSICHLNLAERVKDQETMVQLIEHCCKKGVVYWAVNYVLKRCPNQHVYVGNGDVCPFCGKKFTDFYTRVVGFFTNIKNWNETRRNKDFPNRYFEKSK